MAMRKPIYLRYADGDDPKPGEGGGGGGSDRTHELGFPRDTPLVEMTTEQQLAYWKHHARRHEGVAQSRADYDQQKADAEKWRQAQRENLKPDERAIEDAKEQARREERNRIAPRLVKAEFKTLGRDLPEGLLDFLDDIDHTKYLTADGEVDTAKVKQRVEKLVPAKGDRKPPVNHAGYRENPGTPGTAMGRSLWEARQKKSHKS